VRNAIHFSTFAVACVAAVAALGARPAQTPAAGPTPPPWAYPVAESRTPRPPDDGTARQVPGSTQAFTLTETRNLFAPPDWRPDAHPSMPDVVAYGRRSALFACGYCHLPNGFGRPENSGVAGLPVAYIVQQMADFKNDARRSAEPDMGPPSAMIRVAKAATDEEVRLAAEYFAAVPLAPWVRVVETNSVPKSVVAGSMWVPVEGGGTEPIGQRIVELPEDVARTELRDASSGFVAYVPNGSIARGRAIAAGEAEVAACATCHGPGLHGLGPVPPLAGRSPSYTVRQLYDLQSGARNGAWADLMTDVVDDLSLDDMVALAAYTASLSP